MSKTKDYSMTLDEIIEAGEELVASYKKTASTAEIILNAVKEFKALFSENSVATTEKPEAKPLPDKISDKKEAPSEWGHHVTPQMVLSSKVHQFNGDAPGVGPGHLCSCEHPDIRQGSGL